jgi:citrate/tricarballylate utilization protein
MPSPELLAKGAHEMAVCNSCRYCEQYCPVFPAMERRHTFRAADLAHLANLCHNCGECLYACQYAPPHEFGVEVPRTMARLRLASYEDHAWPRAFGRLYQRQGPATALGLAAGLAAVVAAATAWGNPGVLTAGVTGADFYAVIPHHVMVGLFGVAGGFAAAALGVALARYWRTLDAASAAPVTASAVLRALRDGLSLRHLHDSGPDCVSAEEVRSPWRRWWHHATLGGFLLCFASTTVAAVYHVVFGWQAPHAWTSLPVVLGAAGGVGLVVGPAGQWWERRRRDPALGDPAQGGMDQALLLLLWLTSVTGLAVLALRARPVMAPLLVVHLGVVLALFVALPYGKFVHGLYRLLALVRDAAEAEHLKPSAH